MVSHVKTDKGPRRSLVQVPIQVLMPVQVRVSGHKWAPVPVQVLVQVRVPVQVRVQVRVRVPV